jgi:hypothetical protein
MLRNPEQIQNGRRTNNGSQENTQISGKHIPTKRPCLRSFIRILAQHRPDRNYAARKHTGQASGNYHLPYRLRHAKERRGESDSGQTEDQHWFPAKSVCSPAIDDHQQHLREREERLNQSRVESHILLVEVAIDCDHLVYEREDGEEGYWLS